MDYQYILRKEIELDKTVNVKKLIGKNVLSEGGTVVGTIYEVRLNPNGFDMEGIVVSTRVGMLYIGKSYFSSISDYSVILNTELGLLVRGRRVITVDGKILGKVKQVNRKGNTNEIENLLVGTFWKKYLIPVSAIKQIASSVLLKTKYDDAKEYIWKRSQQNPNI